MHEPEARTSERQGSFVFQRGNDFGSESRRRGAGVKGMRVRVQVGMRGSEEGYSPRSGVCLRERDLHTLGRRHVHKDAPPNTRAHGLTQAPRRRASAAIYQDHSLKSTYPEHPEHPELN